MRMKYHECRDEVITAMNAARNGNIISRGAIEMEIENNASRYPRLSGCKRFVIRLAISTVLLNTPGVSVLGKKKPVFVVG